MNVQLIAVGTRMPSWINEGFEEYQKRLAGDIKLQLTEVTAGKRSKNSDISKILDTEGDALLSAVPSGYRIVTLDIPGKIYTTEKLADRLRRSRDESENISLLIGGPEGLAPKVKNKAQESWSLSALTLPHPLVRVLLAEQVYRCWSLLAGHPYHKK